MGYSCSTPSLFARLRWLLLLSGTLISGLPAFAQKLHTAPIIIKADQIRDSSRHPISTYRLFRTTPQGTAEAIPFQIDEINEDGDYVLDQGKDTTARTGNTIFDRIDELSFMGDDVGPVLEPTAWPMGAPNFVYELTVTHPTQNPMGPSMGAVYIGIYYSSPPALSPKKYVIFQRNDAVVTTSRYKYQFDSNNWLIAKRVEVAKNETEPYDYQPVLNSSTFYMKGDLKYFITFEANHRSINSELEAWKSGPIRSLIRVSFFYSLLKLKIKLDMYTEISFFSNAVYLPAIMYNPIDGRKSLNTGSGMYYGLALKDSPKNYSIETNMAPALPAGTNLVEHGKNFISSFMNKIQDEPVSKGLYWISAQGLGRTIYMEIAPGQELQRDGVAPTFYQENLSAEEMSSRSNNDALALGKSPVNLGIAFDMTKFSEGEHMMGFRLFFENVVAPERLAVFKGLNDWQYTARKIKLNPRAPTKEPAP